MEPLPKAIKNFRVDAQSGLAFTLKKGEIVRIIDVEGEQVADLFCFAKEELEQYLEQMKKEIEKECIEKIMHKLESKTIR